MKSYLPFFLLFIAICTHGQGSNVILNTPYPEAGQQITFTYSGKLAKEGTRITCFNRNWSTFYFGTKVIPCKIVDNQLVGTFTLPDSASFFGFKIENKNEIDSNDGNGFGFNVYKNGKPIKKTFITEGYYMDLNKYSFGGDFDPEKAIRLFEKEYQINPELRNSTFASYLTALARIPSRKIEAIDMAKIELEEVLKTGKNEKSSPRLINLIAGNNNKVADSLKALFIEKYPSGIVAFFKKYSELLNFRGSQSDTVLIIYDSIKKGFPNLDLIPKRLIAVELMETYGYRNDSLNFKKTLNQYYNDFRYQNTNDFIGWQLNETAWRLSLNPKNIELAKLVSEKSIEAHLKHDSLSIHYGNALDTYAAILFKLGDKERALTNQKKAVNLMNYGNVGKNQKLVEYLMANGQFEEAKQKAKEFLVEKLSNAKIDSLYVVASMKTNSPKLDSEYVSSKENAEADFIKKIKNNLIEMPAPDFELKDLNGKTVKLSDLRGNIVVLDFWATWCGPCIKGFPAMKKAMSEFKEQPVKFLFIDTYENEDKTTTNNAELLIKIKKTLNNKQVNGFTVLLDQLKNNYYDATERYNVTSIPAKFVIDKKGMIRYKSTGFSTDENLIKELKTVVKMISE